MAKKTLPRSRSIFAPQRSALQFAQTSPAHKHIIIIGDFPPIYKFDAAACQ
jgi:hypothetical protein